MIDHASIAVTDIERAKRFYDAVLEPIGLTRLVSSTRSIGYGKKYPEIWMNFRETVSNIPDPGAHICLRAPGVEAVNAFHRASLEAGGTSAGEPGVRVAAVTNYYGAFILDPDGNKLEAVTFDLAEAQRPG